MAMSKLHRLHGWYNAYEIITVGLLVVTDVNYKLIAVGHDSDAHLRRALASGLVMTPLTNSTARRGRKRLM
jgi:hypothetical protein